MLDVQESRLWYEMNKSFIILGREYEYYEKIEMLPCVPYVYHTKYQAKHQKMYNNMHS